MNINMEAIILAGGFGTRLQEVVKDVPKPMADIGGRPFLSYIIESLSFQNIRNIILSVGYKAEVIMNYFGHRYKDSIIKYIIEDQPLGTGGAIKRALKETERRDIVVLNGDSFFDIDYEDYYRFHTESCALITMAVKHMHNSSRYGAVSIDAAKRIVAFEEKFSTGSGYINAGVYLMNKSVFPCINLIPNDFFSFEVDFLQQNVQNINLFAYESDAYFIDIGIPEDLLRAQREFANMIAIRRN